MSDWDTEDEMAEANKRGRLDALCEARDDMKSRLVTNGQLFAMKSYDIGANNALAWEIARLDAMIAKEETP